MTISKSKAAELLRRNNQVIWDCVEGTTLLCNTGTVEFFKLNDTGAMIWELCERRTVEEVIETVHAQCPIADRTLIAALVRDYIHVLQKEGLLETPQMI